MAGLELINIHTSCNEPYSAEETADGFNYIFTDKSSGIRPEQLSGVEEIMLSRNDEFTLYKNLDPKPFLSNRTAAQYIRTESCRCGRRRIYHPRLYHY